MNLVRQAKKIVDLLNATAAVNGNWKKNSALAVDSPPPPTPADIVNINIKNCIAKPTYSSGNIGIKLLC